MANFGFTGYLKTYRLSVMRLLVVGTIISIVFLADHFLAENISIEISQVWHAACTKGTSAAACLGRVESHHDKCFDMAYSSMLMRFGQSRWESLKIEDYENCMASDEAVDKQGTKFTITGDFEQ